MRPESIYYNLSDFAKTFNYGPILNEVKDYFGYLHDKEEMDDVGLKLQICFKLSKPMYLHGYVLTSALYKYLTDNTHTDINIFETGTARGFSSVMMAKILEKKNISGKILTIDRGNEFDNCLKAAQLKRKVTIDECVEEWNDLVNKYIDFKLGDSNAIIEQLEKENQRIHFAFLDGSHFYEYIKKELEFVDRHQVSGDVIICDDYTEKQFPQICKAINDFLSKKTYESKIFYGNDGRKKRGYVYMKKI